MSDGAPKSAVEIALEKLARQDVEAGVETRSLTDAQREAIAEVRRDYDAKVAQTRILYESKLAETFDPEARQTLEAEYRRDLSSLANFRDKKMKAVTDQE